VTADAETDAIGVGEEYAISAAANPTAGQSAHRRSADPNRRRNVSPALEGVFLPRGEAGATSGTAVRRRAIGSTDRRLGQQANGGMLALEVLHFPLRREENHPALLSIHGDGGSSSH